MLAVPVSLVGTFALFPAIRLLHQHHCQCGPGPGYRLVVDDAIVVVEGVQRHIEEGLAPKDAAMKAMKELSGPVVGIALGVGFGVVPTGVHSGHHRETLSTIRSDHRHCP